MSEEVKLILDKLNEDKDYDDYVDYKGSYFKPLLDYINNLQEENEHLDKANCHLRKKINNDIYKQRNEKARAKLQSMFDNGNEETILDDLLELDRVLGDDKSE